MLKDTQTIKLGIESHLSGLSEIVVVGEPRIKNVIPFSLRAKLNMIQSIEYLVAPKGNGIYNLHKLNDFLRSITPSLGYLQNNFSSELEFDVYNFRGDLINSLTRIKYISMGKMIFSGKPISGPITLALSEGEYLVPPIGEVVKINQNQEFDADAITCKGVILFYPHEELARRSYQQAESGHPVSEIPKSELKEVKRKYSPNLIERILF